MKATLISVGTRVPTWVECGFLEFNRRMPTETRLSLIEIEAPKNAKHKSASVRKEDEAALILKHIKSPGCLIALDEKGMQFSSIQFAKKIESLSLEFPAVYFVIGGADGLADSIKTKANLLMSFSAFTFPHMLVRVILAEQWYRAATLMAGHPYHRE